MNVHGDLQIGHAIREEKSEEIGIGDFDGRIGDFEGVEGGIVIGFEMIEIEDGFDVLGPEGALDVTILELLDDLGPGVAGAEVETQLREVELGFGVGEGDAGDGEIEASRLGETEFVKRDGGSRIGSDFSRTDLGQRGIKEEEENYCSYQEEEGGPGKARRH